MKRAWLPSADRQRGVVRNTVGWRGRQGEQVLYFVVISLMLDQSGDSEQIFGYERCFCNSILNGCGRVCDFHEVLLYLATYSMEIYCATF